MLSELLPMMRALSSLVMFILSTNSTMARTGITMMAKSRAVSSEAEH